MSRMSAIDESTNVAARLSTIASERPSQIAVATPGRRDGDGKRVYHSVTFVELEQDTNRIASGLIAAGARPGMRVVLLVRPSIDFIALVFALLKTGVVMVLIDPGMGRRSGALPNRIAARRLHRHLACPRRADAAGRSV